MDETSHSLLTGADDRALADRAAEGDVRAFTVLVKRHGPVLRTYATRILGSTADTDDVVQEAFISAWRQLARLENRDSVRSWLITITTRLAIDRVRARREHESVDTVEDRAAPESTPEQRAETSSLNQALSRVLSTLPDDQRRCWILREVFHHSYVTIATELGLPVSTVRGLLARARKTLMNEMEAWR